MAQQEVAQLRGGNKGLRGLGCQHWSATKSCQCLSWLGGQRPAFVLEASHQNVR